MQPEEKPRQTRFLSFGGPLANSLDSHAFGKNSFGLAKNSTAFFTYLRKVGQAIPSGGDCRSSCMLEVSSTSTPDGRTAKAFCRPVNLWERAKMENLNIHFYSLKEDKKPREPNCLHCMVRVTGKVGGDHHQN